MDGSQKEGGKFLNLLQKEGGSQKRGEGPTLDNYIYNIYIYIHIYTYIYNAAVSITMIFYGKFSLPTSYLHVATTKLLFNNALCFILTYMF